MTSRGNESTPAIQTIADRPAEQKTRDGRHRHPDSEDGQGGRRVPECVRLPDHRDQEDPVPDERDGHRRPEQAEVARAKRDEEPDSGETSEAVEPVVAVLQAYWAVPATSPTDAVASSRRYCRRASSVIGRAKRKPCPSSQPS